MPPSTRSSRRKAEEQDAGVSPRPATSVPKTSNCSSSVPKKSGFGKVAGKAAGKAAGKKKAASKAASVPTKPDSLEEDLPSNEDLKKGFEKDWNGEFLLKYPGEQISERITDLSGVRCKATKVTDGPTGLIWKLRVALRLEGLGVDNVKPTPEEVKKAKSFELNLFYTQLFGYPPLQQQSKRESVALEIIEFLETKGESFFHNQDDACLEKQLGRSARYKPSRRKLVHDLRTKQQEAAAALQVGEDDASTRTVSSILNVVPETPNPGNGGGNERSNIEREALTALLLQSKEDRELHRREQAQQTKMNESLTDLLLQSKEDRELHRREQAQQTKMNESLLKQLIASNTRVDTLENIAVNHNSHLQDHDRQIDDLRTGQVEQSRKQAEHDLQLAKSAKKADRKDKKYNEHFKALGAVLGLDLNLSSPDSTSSNDGRVDENSARMSRTMSRYGLDSPASISSEASNSPLSLYPFTFKTPSKPSYGAGKSQSRSYKYDTQKENFQSTITSAVSSKKKPSTVQFQFHKTPSKERYFREHEHENLSTRSHQRRQHEEDQSSYVCSECVRYDRYTKEGAFGQHFTGRKCEDQNCEHYGRTYH